MTTKQLDIKNKSYYFYNVLNNLLNFSMINLKLDKKHGDTLILIILAILTKVNLKIGM